jgi:hypothetical protein
MAKEKQGRVSPARALVSLVWEQSQQAGKSWTRFNGALYQAVHLAIDAVMDFDLEDFTHFWEKMRGSYWFHGDSEAKGESFYRAAVKMGNLTACQSYEKWSRRKPYILDTGSRVHVGSEIDWEGKHCTLTSFDDDRETITLVTYKRDGTKGEECPRCRRADYAGTSKIENRYTVTHTAWVAEMKRRKAMRTPPSDGSIVTAPNGALWIVTFSSTRNRGELALETLKRDGPSIRNPAQRISHMTYPDFQAAGWKVKSPPPKLKMGTQLQLSGVAWQVTYAKSDRINVETVARQKDSDSPVTSHYNLDLPSFVAMGFKVVEKPKKAA